MSKEVKQNEFIIDIAKIKNHNPNLERIVIKLKPSTVSRTRDVDVVYEN